VPETSKTLAALAPAAAALDAELQRYEALTADVQQARLTSQKTLRRAAETLGELGASEARLGERLRGLVEAMNAVRERQQAHAARVQARAAEIRARVETLGALLTRWEALGGETAAVNRLAQALLARGEAPNGDGAEDVFAEVEAGLGRLAEAAAALALAARAEQFTDVADQGEGLRQQLLAVLNKLRRRGAVTS
jgi:DNA repair exonuclease SbcCD ATPase subunit